MGRQARKPVFVTEEEFAELIADIQRPGASPWIRTTNYPLNDNEHITVKTREGGRWYRLCSAQGLDFHVLEDLLRPYLDEFGQLQLKRSLRAAGAAAPSPPIATQLNSTCSPTNTTPRPDED